jgi:hypothetical protein
MPPDQLFLYALLMPASAAAVLLLLPSAPWARGHVPSRGREADGALGRQEAWTGGAAFALAVCASLIVTDGWPWSSAWSSWKQIYVAAGIVAIAGALVHVRLVARMETIALAAAAAVLWYRVPEARDIGIRAIAAAVAACVAMSMWRCALRAPAWTCVAAAAQAFALAGLIGSSGSSKVAAAAGALGMTLALGAIATRASRTFACAAGASLAAGGFGVALALYGRGYHDNIAPWVWWCVAALPGALCIPWALIPARRTGP